jgi:transcriptional regulator with XRE-family HTH domain
MRWNDRMEPILPKGGEAMTIDDHLRLSRNLKLLRKVANYTQFELAEKLGICRTAYSQIERGLRLPDISTLQQLSQIYDVPIDMLLNCDVSDILTHHFLREDNEQEQALLELYEQMSIDAKEQLLQRAEELCHLDMLKKVNEII